MPENKYNWKYSQDKTKFVQHVFPLWNNHEIVMTSIKHANPICLSYRIGIKSQSRFDKMEKNRKTGEVP